MTVGSLSNIEIVAPAGGTLIALRASRPLQMFADESKRFLAELSKRLMAATRSQRHPELTALGYWMRPANLARLEEGFHRSNERRIIVPRGLAFHIAPGNVDTIFVYSWAISLLSGNVNLLRLSSRTGGQLDQLLTLIAALLEEEAHAEIRHRTLLVRYERSDETTAALSSIVDLRIIWGGDDTINLVRRLPLPPRAVDICFPNRFSMAVIDARAWVDSINETRDEAVRGFQNDAYWFGQMACSSPRFLCWIGDAGLVERARDDFWRRLRTGLDDLSTDLTASDFMNKRVATSVASISFGAIVPPEPDAALTRAWFESLASVPQEDHCGAGLFWESRVDALADLSSWVTGRVQTLTYFGIPRESVLRFVSEVPLQGIDRAVPFGRALDFSSVWDGHDLFRAFTREVAVD